MVTDVVKEPLVVFDTERVSAEETELLSERSALFDSDADAETRSERVAVINAVGDHFDEADA